MLALTLAVPAFALEESDVEAAVSSSSREAVTGNVLVWFLCAVGFLKVSQKIDSFMASIGVNVGHTVPSLRAAKCSIIKSNKEFFLEQGHYITKNYIYSG